MKRVIVALAAWAAAAPLLAGDGVGAKLPPCNPATNPDCEPPPSQGEVCLNVTAFPPASRAVYSCEFDVTDAYGRKAANFPVHMETRWCNKFGSKVRASVTSVTDAQGRLTLNLNSGSANQVECALDTSQPTFHAFPSQVKKSFKALPSGTGVLLKTTVQPPPSAHRTLPGGGRMDLFLSDAPQPGAPAYDKVLLVAEQFDQFEHGAGQRDLTRFWRQLAQPLIELFKDGWDVWLVQPRDTGESLHEQAAEFAHAIADASQPSTGLPFLPPGEPACPSLTVGVLGFNTGGLVARIATARWEADVAWRAQLRLPAVLPVKFIATFDAPHYGMHLNLDMQRSLWENKSGFEIHTQTNLDSCAASQMLRGRYDPQRFADARLKFLAQGDTPSVADVKAHLAARTNADFLAFFVDGAPVHFYKKAGAEGVLQDVDRTCEAGPAVATLNAEHGVPGWPSTPIRLGFAQSDPDNRNKCVTSFSAGKDDNFNAVGENLCKFETELCVRFQNGICVQHVPSDRPFTPQEGQAWMRIQGDDPSLPVSVGAEFWDAEDRVEWSDLTPGSRNPFFLDGFVGTAQSGPIFLVLNAHQRFPPTLVPFVSAAGLQGPRGTSNYAAVPSPFNEMLNAGLPRVADVPEPNEFESFLGKLKALPPGCVPVVTAVN